MEEFWKDVSKDDSQFESPPWHADALNEAKTAYGTGAAKFSDWAEAKERIRRKTAKRA